MKNELREVLGLLEKATPGDFTVQHEMNVMAGDGFSATAVQANYYDAGARNRANANALVASANFLRKHGPALSAEPDSDGWMPIESAPFADFHNTHPESCLVYSDQCGVQMGRVWKYADGSTGGQAFGFSGQWEITHWRPLPAPPAARSAAQEK